MLANLTTHNGWMTSSRKLLEGGLTVVPGLTTIIYPKTLNPNRTGRMINRINKYKAIIKRLQPVSRSYSTSFMSCAEGLSEEQRQIQSMALEFANNELSPYRSQWDKNQEFPVETMRKAAQLGFSGIYVNAERGGSGMGRLEASLIFEALSQGCVSTSAYLSIHNMCAWMIDEFGNNQQKGRYLPEMLSMNYLSSYCLTEPSSGSDAASLITTAKKSGDSYILNGSKAFISGAGESQIYLVMARTGEPDSGAKGITCFIVTKEMPGIHFGAKERKMGWNSQPTRVVTFEDCKVPAENILGGEGNGFKIAMKGLVGGRINIASCSLGAAQASLDHALSYVKERKQFGKAIIDYQNTQFKLASMASELVASRLLVRQAASMIDINSQNAIVFSAMAKRFATERCFSICDDALQLLGGYGYLEDYPISQFVRDSRVHRILEGTNEVMQIIIAREIIKED